MSRTSRRCEPVPLEIREAASLLERRWQLSILYAALTGALRFGAARPDLFGAVASYHGGMLATDSPDSPHHLIGNVTAEIKRTTYDVMAAANAVSARGLPGDVYRAATIRTGKLVR